jgi:hypothetical protein
MSTSPVSTKVKPATPRITETLRVLLEHINARRVTMVVQGWSPDTMRPATATLDRGEGTSPRYSFPRGNVAKLRAAGLVSVHDTPDPKVTAVRLTLAGRVALNRANAAIGQART